MSKEFKAKKASKVPHELFVVYGEQREGMSDEVLKQIEKANS